MTKLIFGFGSLISTASVLVTVPDARDFRPAFVRGFYRDFSIWAPEGYTETHLDFAGIPFCALDVRRVQNPQTKINGVTFMMSDRHFGQLLQREREYELVETTAYDYQTSQPIGTATLFSARKDNGHYDFQSVAQAKYLQDCLAGAKQYGEQFFNEFLDTTFIDGKNLWAYPELLRFDEDLLRS